MITIIDDDNSSNAVILINIVPLVMIIVMTIPK